MNAFKMTERATRQTAEREREEAMSALATEKEKSR
jgi:hypothetical protein